MAKKVAAKAAEVSVAVIEKPEPEAAPAPVHLTEHQRAVAESREVLRHPLPAGQAFFESPEGFIVVGESNKDHVLCRKANHGKGMLINRMR